MPEPARFRSDIQGLRAIAVLSVVEFHAWPTLLPGGFVGVDIFFVISGYLMTRILARAPVRSERHRLGDFYVRRTLRLVPALVPMLMVTLLLGCMLLPLGAMTATGIEAAWTIGFASNVHYALTRGYFSPQAELVPLLHGWSLGVEGQFYLVYPLALLTIRRFAPRWLGAALWMMAIGSLGYCEFKVLRGAASGFYLLPGRFWEFLAGAVVAVGAVPKVDRGAVDEALAAIGVTLIAVSIVLLSPSSPFPGVWAIPPTLGTALVLAAGERRVTGVGRLLAFAPFTALGAISYSLYLWHWPLLVYLRYATLNSAGELQVAATVAAGFLAAWASWRFIERPFLRRRSSDGCVIGMVGAGASAVLATAWLASAIIGPATWAGTTPRAMAASARDFSPYRDACHVPVGELRAYRSLCVLGAGNGPVHLAVWGDSFGVELSAALAEGRRVRQATASSCPPAIGIAAALNPACGDQRRIVVNGLVHDRDIDHVVLAASYLGVPPAERDAYLTGLANAAARLRSAGKQVTIVHPIPELPFDGPTALSLIARRGGDLSRFGMPHEAHRVDTAPIERALRAIERTTGAAGVDPSRLLCDSARCHAYLPGVGPIYLDRIHLDMAGARALVRARPAVR